MVLLRSSLNNSNMQPALRITLNKETSCLRYVSVKLPFKILLSLQQGNVIRFRASLINKDRTISNLDVSLNQKTEAKVLFTFEVTVKAGLWGSKNLFSTNKLQGGFCGCLD